MPHKGPLYDHLPAEVPPPPEVWERILNELPGLTLPGEMSQLNQLEMAPPPQTWKNLEKELAPLPAIQPAKNRSLQLAVTIAAAIAAFVLLATVYYFGNPRRKAAVSSVQQLIINPEEQLPFAAPAAGSITGRVPGYLVINSLNGESVKVSEKLQKIITESFGTAGVPANALPKLNQQLSKWKTLVEGLASDPASNFSDPVFLSQMLREKK